MRILALGDLHGELPTNLPQNIDLILLTGDIGKSEIIRNQAFKQIKNSNYNPSRQEIKKGYLEVYNSSVKVLRKLRKIAPVYLVYGNIEHTNKEVKELEDEINYKLPKLDEQLKKLSIKNINKKIIQFKGITIAGHSYFTELGWILRFHGNDAEKLSKNQREHSNAESFFKKLSKVDILLTHNPPFKVLDKVNSKIVPKSWLGKHAGSELILDYIQTKQPKYHIFGHIHESAGEKKIGNTNVINLGERKFKLLEF